MVFLLACVGVLPTDDTSKDPADTVDRTTLVCQVYGDLMANHSEGTWSGNAASCDAGDMDDAWRERALGAVNAYRVLADLPTVELDSSRNEMSQACALMMHANNSLSHYPPQSWKCYTSDGASAAGSSNIATSAAVSAVDMYMQDWGNETTIGHRRWILSNQLGPIGVGSTSTYSCLYVIGGSGSAAKTWMAWPPPGPFPVLAAVDSTGWTIQSDSIDVSRATPEVTADGVSLPMTVSTLESGYGSTYAVKMIPDGWASTAGTTYHVEVPDTDIAYDVEMVDCNL